MNYAMYSLDELEHAAYTEDNALALAIYGRIESEVDKAVEKALSVGDDYSYQIWDAVNAIQELLKADWYKVEETNQNKDRIIYMIQGLHEDTSPYNNQVVLSKPKGSDTWTVTVNAGQYGEQQGSIKFNATGFKDAQKQAVQDILSMIKKGLELNF